MGLTRLSVHRPVVLLTAYLALTPFGILSVLSLGLEKSPQLKLPIITADGGLSSLINRHPAGRWRDRVGELLDRDDLFAWDDHPGTRWRAIATYAGARSKPTVLRPSRCATVVVVPLPTNGSRTTSPVRER